MMGYTDGGVTHGPTGLKKLRLGKSQDLSFRPSYKGPVKLTQCPDCASGYRNSKKVGSNEMSSVVCRRHLGNQVLASPD
jgi:hypothetical protein